MTESSTEYGLRGFARGMQELNPNQLPTIGIVNDTLERYCKAMGAFITKAQA